MKVVSQQIVSIYLDQLRGQAQFLKNMLDISEAHCGPIIHAEVKLMREHLKTLDNAIEYVEINSAYAPVVISDGKESA